MAALFLSILHLQILLTSTKVCIINFNQTFFSLHDLQYVHLDSEVGPNNGNVSFIHITIKESYFWKQCGNSRIISVSGNKLEHLSHKQNSSRLPTTSLENQTILVDFQRKSTVRIYRKNIKIHSMMH